MHFAVGCKSEALQVPSLLSYLMPFTPYPYQGESAACDLCGSSQFHVICEHDRRLKKLRTVACHRCALMRTEPMPTHDEISQYYANTYRFDYGLSFGGPSRRHLNRSQRQAGERLKVLAPALQSPARILDFGSGAGVFLARAKAEGHEVLGIEPGKQFAAYASDEFGIDVINEGWEEVELSTKFDVITAVEVLEHLRHPVRALTWLGQLLADDGVIYITVPNLTPSSKETFRRFHFAHLYNFTPATLLLAGAAAGLEPDPRFKPAGTKIVFRKNGMSGGIPTLERNYGVGLSALYPDASLSRYLMSGRFLAAAGRRLRKTIRDTLRR